VFLMTLCGCEYVRPTLNAPLQQWEPAGGYRFSNLAPPEADNTDGLFIMASFSGGGTRASTLAFGVLRELARQQITLEGKKKRLLDELDAMFRTAVSQFESDPDTSERTMRECAEQLLKLRHIEAIRLYPIIGRSIWPDPVARRLFWQSRLVMLGLARRVLRRFVRRGVPASVRARNAADTEGACLAAQ